MARRAIPAFQFIVRDDGTGEDLGLLADVSNKGARVQCSREFPSGTHLTVSIPLPREVEGLKRVTLESTCLWCRGVDDLWEIGLEFDEGLGREEARALGSIINLWSV